MRNKITMFPHDITRVEAVHFKVGKEPNPLAVQLTYRPSPWPTSILHVLKYEAQQARKRGITSLRLTADRIFQLASLAPNSRNYTYLKQVLEEPCGDTTYLEAESGLALERIETL